MKMCFKILYFLRVRNWIGPIFSAAIIMIFVSCTNINEYVRNYQDCLTLVTIYCIDQVTYLGFFQNTDFFFGDFKPQRSTGNL
jgi:hypothetical protein